jgi:cyclic pyranopterin phosphate synthase
MAAIPIDSVVFSFEGLLPLLDSPPIAARRALDHAGLRLPLEGWRSLPAEERQRLCQLGAAERVEPDQVLAMLRRASPSPQKVPPGTDPEVSAPPEALVRALEPTRGLDPKSWSRLRALDRYALSHTYRRAVARSSFSLLGEAFDSIVASAAAGQPHGPPSSRPRPASMHPPPSPPAGRSPLRIPSPAPMRAPAFAPRPRTDDELTPRGQVMIESSLSTHLSAAGEVRMVGVGEKVKTARRAVAAGSVLMKPETVERIMQHDAPKGEVLATARIAGIMAAKRTPELIPLCHGIALTKVTVDIEVDVDGSKVDVIATAEAVDRTGVEMEAMVAVSVACLTIYDMLKSKDREMLITDVRLLEKSGGKSGHFVRDEGEP